MNSRGLVFVIAAVLLVSFPHHSGASSVGGTAMGRDASQLTRKSRPVDHNYMVGRKVRLDYNVSVQVMYTGHTVRVQGWSALASHRYGASFSSRNGRFMHVC